jgi:hypothetical protein
MTDILRLVRQVYHFVGPMDSRIQTGTIEITSNTTYPFHYRVLAEGIHVFEYDGFQIVRCRPGAWVERLKTILQEAEEEKTLYEAEAFSPV